MDGVMMGQHSTTRVLVGTDGSPTAQQAVTAAAEVAKHLSVPLMVATAWYREDPDAEPLAVQVTSGRTNAGASANSWAEGVVSDAAAFARGLGVEDVRTRTPVGNPADALVGLALDHPGTLTIVGTVATTEGSTRISPTVITNATTNRCHISTTPVRTTIPIAAITNARHACVTMMSRRRSDRSTMTPPNGANVIHGRN